MLPFTAVFLQLFNFGGSILTGLISSKVWDKFNNDLEKIIFKLIEEQNQKLKKDFPEAAMKLKEKEMIGTITKHFGNLTAHQLEKPLDQEEIAHLFADLFLEPQFRESEQFDDIDPKYRNALIERAVAFVENFKLKTQSAFIRNSAASTTILLNSLALSGKKDEEILGLLQKIYSEQGDLSTMLGDMVQIQLLPAIQKQIQDEFNRFREDWKFILRVLRFETAPDEEDEREWLEQLAQVLEWKGFTNIQRRTIQNVRGELFEMEEIGKLGQMEKWLCWGCPARTSPEETEIRLISTHKQEHANAKLFVISQSKLSQNIVNISKSLGIETHLTMDEFVQTILNIKNQQNTVIADYETKPIYHHYIDLFCHKLQEKEPIDLKDNFYTWLNSEDTNHISLLGNFGTGKTEFCQRMQWELLKNYSPINRTRIPVMITLREQKGLRLPQIIDSIMNTMGLKQIDYAAFRTLNRMGMFVIMIDGFDEMATNATVDDMIANFRELTVLAEGRAKVFLTCRTHYFEHEAREKEVLSLPEFIAERPEFQVLYLNPFTREQIEAYLDKVKDLRKPKQDVLKEMDRHPRLKELMQTPVLLDMILKIFPELMEADEQITLSLVYKKATGRWVADEKKKGRLQKIESREVLQFMEELAWQMHREENLVINYKKLKNQIYDRFQKSMQVDFYDFDAFYGEIRTCSFLTRDSTGDYRFVHKSFMEYFTACYLAPKLLEDNAPEEKINEEIRQFLHYLLLPQVNYKDDQYKFTGTLWSGMKRCEEHNNCFIHLKDNSEMVWIPQGQFIAGGEHYYEEKPIRIMHLGRGAFLDKYLVTNAQYARFLNENDRFEERWIKLKGKVKSEKCRILKKGDEFHFEPGYENHPVIYVSHFGAQAYAQWAGKELPSEWLWGKAGRGIDGRTYPWGDEFDNERCNIWESGIKGTTHVTCYLKGISPYGCYDMAGNVWEWIDSWYDNKKQEKVVRGGSWYSFQDLARCANRTRFFPNFWNAIVGFRCARTK